MTILLNHAQLVTIILLFGQWFSAIIVGQQMTISQEELDGIYMQIFTTEPTTGVSSSTQNDPISNCECAPFYQCKGYDQMVESLIDPRMSVCNGSIEICCEKSIDHPAPVLPPLPRPMEAKCGLRNVYGVGFRITTTGEEAQFGEFPWMIALLKQRPTADKQVDLLEYHCGGSLIHLQVVLTATHCVNQFTNNLADLRVRAGEWDSQTTDEIVPYQERRVSQIISHKNFSKGALYNDISLLLLDKPFEYAQNVDVICLPDQSVVYNDSNCVASGWGKDKFGKEGSYQNILKKVDLPLLDRNQCLARLRQTKLGKTFQLHESFICAGGITGKDTCEGDGGSPLVCPIADKRHYYRQVGIVSWGIGCSNDIPGVYVNVPKYRNWIDEQMKLLDLKL